MELAEFAKPIRVPRHIAPGRAPRGRRWDPQEHDIRVRATGTTQHAVRVYRGTGQEHYIVVGPESERTYLVDETGYEDDPWWVVRVLAYGFLDLVYRETIRYQRVHVWRLGTGAASGGG